jgi:hypothetical protein
VPSQPLSPGNVVTIAIALYRAHLKTYFRLALIAHLWLFIPIYGLGKFVALSGLISRLAFGELIHLPESVEDANRKINQRVWSFFWAATLSTFLVFGSFMLIFLGSIILLAFVGGLIGLFSIIPPLSAQNPTIIILLTIIGIILYVAWLVAFFGGIAWYYSRWLIAEIPLAIEDGISGKESVDRSWELTKSSVRQIQGILLVWVLVSSPLTIWFSNLMQIVLTLARPGSNLETIGNIINILLAIAMLIFLLPFWQVTKAVLYYDLRSRKEGLDLQRISAQFSPK